MSRGNAISELGQMTGSADTDNGSLHAFVTDFDGKMVDLNVLASVSAYSEGYDSNNAGQV